MTNLSAGQLGGSFRWLGGRGIRSQNCGQTPAAKQKQSNTLSFGGRSAGLADERSAAKMVAKRLHWKHKGTNHSSTAMGSISVWQRIAAMDACVV
jgi:hypothetical protein